MNNMKEVLTNPPPLTFRRVLWVSTLLLLVMGGCRGCVWLSQDRIDTDDFESVRSTIEPDLQELFDEAEQEFARGDRIHRFPDSLAQERYGVELLIIRQFEGDDGMAYEVLFAYGGVRGFAGGYYYTPSGALPPWAPYYGVVCSKHMDGPWYAFNTVGSENPPDPEDCPEDTQYR